MAKKNSGTVVVVNDRSTKARKSKGQKDERLITTHANGAQFSDKRPGVIATIVEMLEQASESNPVTKSAILAKLVSRFPDRLEANMKSTLSMQVPSGLKIERATIVRSNENGYWIDKKATEKAQAERSKARAEKKAARANEGAVVVEEPKPKSSGKSQKNGKGKK